MFAGKGYRAKKTKSQDSLDKATLQYLASFALAALALASPPVGKGDALALRWAL